MAPRSLPKGDSMSEKTIIRAKGGTDEREVFVDDISVPDLWHIAMALPGDLETGQQAYVLECWHLCHDLLRHIIDNE